MKNTYAKKTTTALWHEIADPDTPYNARFCRLHGYDLFDVAKNCNFIQTLYLLFNGELPSNSQSEILEKLMIFLINPGPRHAATRAAMNAGVSKAESSHILPTGLIVMGGKHLGALEVENAFYFISENIERNPSDVAKELILHFIPATEGDNRIAPGFGSLFNNIDHLAGTIALQLCNMEGAGNALKWCSQFVETTSEKGMSWLNTGIAAAVYFDLGFGAREAAGLFQLMSAPGILAHGLEQTHKPITAMPMIEDENYVIEKRI